MINVVFSKMEAYSSSHGIELSKLRKVSSESSSRQKTEEDSKISEQENIIVNFKALDQYVYVVTQNMVDDVCLHDARVKAVEYKYSAELERQPYIDKEDHDRLVHDMVSEIQRIPLRSVSGLMKPEENPNRVPVEIQNEAGNLSGKFGWCISCRGKANLFCKDTRHPVCSFECKQKHMGLLDSIES